MEQLEIISCFRIVSHDQVIYNESRKSKLRRIVDILKGERQDHIGPIERAVQKLIAQGSKNITIELSKITANWVVRGD